MKVAALYIYLIKGCRALRVETVDVNQEGLVGDRTFMVINEEGAHLSQKHCPRLATLVPTLTSDGFKVEAADGDVFEHSMRIGSAVSARIHSTHLMARDQGEDIAKWLSEKLNMACRLVAAPEGYQRNVPFPSLGDIHGQRLTLFNDLAPVLLTSQASLDDLNDRLDSPVPMARFRPNIVLEDTMAWEEDDFDVISNGLLALERRAPCERCAITSIDQMTGQRGAEPYRTLGRFRNQGKVISSGIWFGAYMAVTNGGRINVGDHLHPVS